MHNVDAKPKLKIEVLLKIDGCCTLVGSNLRLVAVGQFVSVTEKLLPL